MCGIKINHWPWFSNSCWNDEQCHNNNDHHHTKRRNFIWQIHIFFSSSMSIRSCKPCFVVDNHLSMYFYMPFEFISSNRLPLPNLGFSLVGFTAFHFIVSNKLRHCGTFKIWTMFCNLGFYLPLYAPIYLTLFVPLAQSLPSSQMVRAWTFL